MSSHDYRTAPRPAARHAAGAPLHVVHINSVGLAETPELLEMIKEARAHGRDVTTEAYPYDAGATEIQSATIQDVYRTAPDERLAELEWPLTGERLNRESFERYARIGGPIVIYTNTEQMVAVCVSAQTRTSRSLTQARCRIARRTEHRRSRLLAFST